MTNELKGIWAADFFVVQTVNFRTLYMFFFMAQERREVVHFNATASPTAAWAWQQFVNATPWARQPRYVIHDRDAIYGKVFPSNLEKSGVTSVRTPIRAPRANAVAEPVVRTVRNDCLDHLIVLSEDHLRTLLKEYVYYYNEDRPHRSLELQSPRPREAIREGRVTRRAVLGGPASRLCSSA